MAQKYSKAKFRNVEFYVADATTVHGRRNVVHEYPQRDLPFSEDLGRKAKEFQVEGYVIGDDVLQQRDRLIEALDTEGSGVLVHPYYGQRFVACTSSSFKETSSENRIVRFTLSFTEAGEASVPKSSPDSAFKVMAASETLREAAISDFEKVFSVAKSAQFVVQSAITKLKAASAKVKSLTGNASALYQQAADLAFAIRQLENDVVDLVNSPRKMAEQIKEGMRLLSLSFDRATSNRQAFNAQTALVVFGAGEQPGPVNTASRQQEERNRVALNELTKRLALANAADEAVAMDMTSVDDAAAIRSQLLDASDDLMLKASDDAVFDALVNLSAQLAQAIPKASEALPRIVTVTPDQMMPSLVLTYRMFGNLDQELELVARNKIAHPAFIEAGTDVQVLGNG